MNKAEHYLGIMICETKGKLPFPEQSFFRKLCIIGRRYGLIVYVFSPLWLRAEGIVSGYTYTKQGWTQKTFPLPSIIYDRCSYSSWEQYAKVQAALERMMKRRNILFLGNGLKGKWSVHRMLIKDDAILPYVPETEQYEGSQELRDWLAEHGGEAFLKPHSGSHGKNTLYVRLDEETGKMYVHGRDQANRLIRKTFREAAAGFEWIHRFIGSRKFIMQTYLRLNNRNGEPFDIRALVQKGENGLWQLTGMAVRKGKTGTLTSNLHGGGQAAKVSPFLEQEFGKEKGEAIIEQIRQLSARIPEVLESGHGRLVELGIDFGVDWQGRLWILEVNSKPGRTVFLRIGDTESSAESVENPIRYARYLVLRQLRRVNS